METILTMAKMLTNERQEFEFIRKTVKISFLWPIDKKGKSKDLPFFIHCESNGISSIGKANCISPVRKDCISPHL